MRHIPFVHIFVVIAFAAILSSCGSSNVTQNLSAEDRFELGKNKFNDGSYLDAINEFEIVKIQYPGSSVADDAQLYLADSRYHLEEFLLAAEEYQTLKRNMPASPFVPEAQFKTAMCYYNLSPKSLLDQRYTKRALDEFQTFLEYYPMHKLAPEADAKIKELNTRLAKKLFDSAELYMTMEYYKAATIYYNAVVEKYHDTKYAEPAMLGKVKSLVIRKKYDEAKEDIAKFLARYPESEMKNEAEGLRKDVDDHLKSKSSTGSPTKSSDTTQPQ
jgi:outer membrane protein assembly factor BamD